MPISAAAPAVAAARQGLGLGDAEASLGECIEPL
jgi:hypothetical protein